MDTKLKQFRIRNYRIIEDTGWIDADDVTALVGINESGKSAILTALYKLNPSIPTPYDGLAEFPHDRYHEFRDNGKDIPVASVRFMIGDTLRNALTNIHAIYSTCQLFECTRNYDGTLTTIFDPAVNFNELTIENIKDFLSKAEKQVQKAVVVPELAQAPSPINPENEQPSSPDTENIIVEFKRKLIASLDDFGTSLLPSDNSHGLTEHLKYLSQTFRALSSEDWQNEIIASLLEQINELISLENVKLTLPQALKMAESHLPIFILFEDYGTLRGDIYIPEYLRVYKAEKPPEWVRTANALFKLATYPIDKITDLHQRTQQTTSVPKQENRQLNKAEEEAIQRAVRESSIRKEASSLWISQRFNQWWPIGDYKIHLDPSPDYFQLRVSDARRDISVELDYRSRGFKYFLSFFLVFEAESDGGHKDAVLLLDEPGIHLHPAAQKLLLKFFDNVAKNNQLIYTTHLPFLIDGNHLERVRAVLQSKDTGETYVTGYLGTKDSATLLPIQEAIGYAISQTLFMGKSCLIVEGWTDYWAIKTMDHLLLDAQKPGLDPDIYVTPTGGTNTIPWNAQIIAAQDIPFIILLDSDKAGESTRNEMIQKMMALSEQFVMLGDVIGRQGIDFEGLFAPEYFIDATVNAYQIPAFTEADLGKWNSVGIAEAIRRYFDKQGFGPFEKARVYLWLVRKWTTQPLEQLPPDFVSNIERLFQAINTQFQILKQ